MIRLERRAAQPAWLAWVVPVAAVLAAAIAGGVVIRLNGYAPGSVYSRIADRAFSSEGALSATIVSAGPLLFTGLAASIAFRMRIFNIGAEGQFVCGSVAASGVGLLVNDSPTWLVIVVMAAAGALAGALWAAIPGFLRAWLHTNEIITTLMFNYLAANFASYLIFGSESHWRELTGTGLMFPQGRRLPEAASWPQWEAGGVTWPVGFVVGAAVAAGLLVVFRRTRFGFQVRVMGDEPRAAHYAGVRTRRTILGLMALSGAVAGLGGAADVGGVRHVLDPKALNQAGYGYAGIVVAALARFNPVAVVFVSVLMGGLANAGRSLQGPDFPAGLVGTLQGLLLLFAVGGEVFAHYRIRRVGRPGRRGRASASTTPLIGVES